MRHGQDAAEYLAGTFQVTAGPVTLTGRCPGQHFGYRRFWHVCGGHPGYFEVTFTSAPLAEVIMTCDVFLPAGSDLSLASAIGGLPIEVTTTAVMNVGDTYKAQDPCSVYVLCRFELLE